MERDCHVSRSEATRLIGKLGRVSNVIRQAVPEFAPFDYQACFLDDHFTRWAHVTKSRQVGWSQEEAHHGVMKAVSLPRYKKIYTSLNLDDCKEKIEYAKELFEMLLECKWLRHELPAKDVWRKTEISFSNGSRLISAFSPRGQSRADISMDEFSWYQNPKKIYNAALPIMIHGGQLRIGASPSHSASMFSAIARRDGGKFTQFRRFEIFWWDCPIHCRNVTEAREKIFDRNTRTRLLPTEEAVRTYGTEVINEIFDNMPTEDFQQEFENSESDDERSFFPWELIIACTPTGEESIERYETLTELRDKTKDSLLWAGYDVGRRRDSAELTVFEEKDGLLLERYRQHFDNTPFPVQAEELDAVLSIPNVLGLAIDQTGMGEQLAEERVMRWGERVTSVYFTEQIKKTMATNIKMMMEKAKVFFQADKEARFQMHSIKKIFTTTGKILFDVDTQQEVGSYSGHHHADIFWARALALYAKAMSMKLGRPTIGGL